MPSHDINTTFILEDAKGFMNWAKMVANSVNWERYNLLSSGAITKMDMFAPNKKHNCFRIRPTVHFAEDAINDIRDVPRDKIMIYGVLLTVKKK